MIKLIIGFVLGVVVATVGVSGIVQVMDNGVQTIQKTSKDLVQ